MTIRSKSLLLLSIMMLSSLVSYAQKNEEQRKGYMGNAEFILGALEVGLNTTQGYRLNNKWSFGANTGVNISWFGPVLPLCAVAQFDIAAGKNTSVLINAKAGGAFALTNDSDLKKRAGGNFALGTGFSYKRMTYQLAYNLVLLKFSHYDVDELTEGEVYATIQFRVGFSF